MRLLIFSLFAVSVFLTTGLPPAWALSASYRQEIKLDGQVISKQKFTLKGDMQKIETSAGGFTQLLIKNSEGHFSYIPQQNIITRIASEDDGKQGFTRDIENFSEFLEQNHALRVGSETLRGYECDIYEFKDPVTGSSGKAWVWKEHPFPVQIRTQTPQGMMSIELSAIKVGIDIPDSEFKLPKGIPVMDFTSTLTGHASDEGRL